MGKIALCISFSIYSLSLVFLSTDVSWSASRQLGGSGLGFSCDMNKQECKCDGVETGADCVGMKKNCSGKLTCIDPKVYPGQAARCYCNMSATVRPPRESLSPTLKQPLKGTQ
jgi:hypothetical protein